MSSSEVKPEANGTAAASPAASSPHAASVTESSMEVDSMNGTPKDTPASQNGKGGKNGTTSTNGEDATSGDKKKKRKSVGTAGSFNKTYIQLVTDAIADMKDRTGSSLAAIKKWILTKYPEIGGPHFASRVNLAIKNGLNSKPAKLTKIRASYKISAEFREAARSQRRKAARAAAAQNKDKTAARKVAAFEKKLKTVTPEQAAAMLKAKQDQEASKAAAELEVKRKTDRLRRRRFPMEDTRLHKEDIELGAKTPADVIPRPYLPYFWQVTLPLKHPARSGKTSGGVLAASKVDGLDCDTRGLVPDLMQVYHFFRGDVHFTMGRDVNGDDEEIVPEFTLKHLIFAVEQVQNGNARRSKLVPPLLVHLFVTCLQILCQPPAAGGGGSRNEHQLQKDLHEYLGGALSPASWSDVMYLYMDAMERYYGTDASKDPNVLQPLETDLEYLFERTDKPSLPAPSTPGGKAATIPEEKPLILAAPLPGGYNGYLGDPRSTLFRAHGKLARQDPWLLTAEELMALLRVLTDDILASHPAASADLANREEEMNELSKAKRAADMKFRKLRLAFEGPQKPSRPRAKLKDDSVKVEEKKDETTEEVPFKPTATKKQFEAALKAQEKASEAYERGIRNLVARTEPVGYDRNFNPVYCFRHDPEVLYVEESRPAVASNPSSIPAEMLFKRYSWHVIETASLFDQFTASLDIRGRREHDLYEELVGPPGSHQSLRRFLHDDVKAHATAKARIKEIESLKKRMEIARVKCDEEKGRRSSRNAGKAELELSQVQYEIDELEKQAAAEKAPVEKIVAVRDYAQLTGFDILKNFELAGRVETRRTREKKAVAQARKLPLMRCTKLCSTGNIDGTGIVGMLVASLLELEEHCESLAPWDRKDMTRAQWIAHVEGAVPAWTSISPEFLGSADLPDCRSTPLAAASSPMDVGSPDEKPKQSKRDSMDSNGSAMSKRRKFDSPSASSTPSSYSVQSIVSLMKQPLLDLEARVADITNVALATRDADLADDNMSVTDTSAQDEANKEKVERAWKKLVYKIRHTPAKKHAQIRELLVSAIGAARKAHLQQVVAQLRAALLKFHPNAANECKVAAVKVLDAHGGYAEDEDEDSDDEAEGKEEAKEEAVPSVLSAEAATLRSSLGGSDDSTRADWITMVKSVKAVSRLASLTAAFVADAMEKIEKLEIERDELTYALQMWTKAEERQVKQRDSKKKSTGAAPKEIKGPSEVWANVRYSDEMCMAKAEDFPWWPAKKCEAKDPEIASALSKLNRSLVAFVGEMGSLRVVKAENLKPFTGEPVEEDDEVEYTKDMRTQLDDCMTMSRRIQRGLRLQS